MFMLSSTQSPANLGPKESHSKPVHHMIRQRLAWRSGGGRSGRFPGGRSWPPGDPPRVLTSRPYLSSMRTAQGPDLCPGWDRAECWPLPWELASAPFPWGDCRRACLPHCASSSSLEHSTEVSWLHDYRCEWIPSLQVQSKRVLS